MRRAGKACHFNLAAWLPPWTCLLQQKIHTEQLSTMDPRNPTTATFSHLNSLRWETVAFCEEKDADNDNKLSKQEEEYEDDDDDDVYDLDDIDFNEIDEVGEFEDDTGMLFPPSRREIDDDEDEDEDDIEDETDDEQMGFGSAMAFPKTEKEKEEQNKLFDLWFAQFHQRLVEQHMKSAVWLNSEEAQQPQQQQQPPQQPPQLQQYLIYPLLLQPSN